MNAWRSLRGPRNAPLDPWDARSYEWMTTSPPKAHNFDAIPVVHTIDEFFHRKYAEDEETGKLRQVATAEELLAEQEAHADHHIHLPSPSYWPIILALALPFIGYGIIFNRIIGIIGIGVLILVLAMFGWAMEPSVAPDSDYDPHPEDDGPGSELATVGSEA